MPIHDPAWRGEENYFVRLTELFYHEMKKHKPDAVHIGCAGHYWLASWIDVNRTYDIFSSNWREHQSRAQMLIATCPGVPPVYDFPIVLENLEEWFASARLIGAGVQIGNLLRMRRDWFTPPVPADADYYRRLRDCLTPESSKAARRLISAQ